mgnify:CR=1 FL=1
MKSTVLTSLAVLAGCALASLSPAAAQDSCGHRGQLDMLYCDEDRDLVADLPKDPAKLRDPSTLVWAYTPVEDPAIYANIFKPFTDYLGQCVGKRIVYYPVQSNSAEIEAMRSGRLHFAGFSTGPTGFAVNLAGAVPFAAKGLSSLIQKVVCEDPPPLTEPDPTPSSESADDDVPVLTDRVAEEDAALATAPPHMQAQLDALREELARWLEQELPHAVLKVTDGLADQLMGELTHQAEKNLLPRLIAQLDGRKPEGV